MSQTPGDQKSKGSQLLECCFGTLHCRVKSLAMVVQLDGKVHYMVRVNLMKKQPSYHPEASLTSCSITFNTVSGLINFV